MTPEEAYEEALHRIRQAEETGAVELDLSGLSELTRLPQDLERLITLRKLHADDCKHLGIISSFAKLTALEELWLNDCTQLDDLSPLAALTELQELRLHNCIQLNDLLPLANLTSLELLALWGCEKLSDLSPLIKVRSLKILDLSLCTGVRRSPLNTRLPAKHSVKSFCVSRRHQCQGAGSRS